MNQIKKITVTMKDGSQVRTWGVQVNEYLAITPSPFPGQWNITHIPSGCVATRRASRLYRDQIPAELRRIAGLNWRGVNPLHMPICELVAVLPAIDEHDGPIVASKLGHLYCEGAGNNDRATV